LIRLYFAPIVILFLMAGCDDTSYPFDSVTEPFTFTYELAADGSVDIFVVNSYLVIVRNLVNDESQTQGSHSLEWDLQDNGGRRVPEGLYYIRIMLDDELIKTLMYEVYK